MIVDVHTHVFPPRMIERRGHLVPRDPAFAEMYGDARSKMATADTLLASMDAAGVDVSVVCGFWWRNAELAEEHAAYLLDVASASGGRLVPVVPVDLAAADAEERIERAARNGARGLGELRPGNQPDATEADALLGRAAEAHGLVAFAHASEEVGHEYAGKSGGYMPGALWRLLREQPSVRVVAAHWGGGFPFYALMPEVREMIEGGRIVFDSAASALLYEPAVFGRTVELTGVEYVLWGSDFPLRDQAADRAVVEAALPDPARRAAVLGENAARFLGLARGGA